MLIVFKSFFIVFRHILLYGEKLFFGYLIFSYYCY